jgi:glycosyltransferase involved in cell wall biosynthesis
VLELLGSCDVLIHPSLHDSGGWVCLEAMAAGRPVVCLDLGGPAFLIGEDAGFKVAADDAKGALAGLVTAMLRLAREPHLRASMGAAGRKRVQSEFCWQDKGRALFEIYTTAAAERA